MFLQSSIFSKEYRPLKQPYVIVVNDLPQLSLQLKCKPSFDMQYFLLKKKKKILISDFAFHFSYYIEASVNQLLLKIKYMRGSIPGP